MNSPTERFSNRVESYVQARPSYPPAAIELLATACGLGPQATVADIGAGTGILTRLLLARGATVYAVEPNAAMRQAAEAALADQPGFVSVAARAEATSLKERSVDLITASQAFHWFEPGPTRREFVRILRPDGWVALIWNERRISGTPFLDAYEQLLHRHGTDYAAVNHQRITVAELQSFFGAAPMQRATFPNQQRLDLQGFQARLTSSSYMPGPGQPGYEAMLDAMVALFARHQRDGWIDVEYDTTVSYGQLR